MSDVTTRELGWAGPLTIAHEDRLQVARILPKTDAEGPGTRTAVWVQGCTLHCPGCFNPHLWATRGGSLTPVPDVIEAVLRPHTQGVTFLGGEPFDQAAPVAAVARAVHAAGRSVMTFTGYTWDQLQAAIHSGRDDVLALLNITDLLVDGPYLQSQIDTSRPWVGSHNQQFRHLTNRYQHLTLDSASYLPDTVELTVTKHGTVEVNGWAQTEVLEELLMPDLRPGRLG